MRLFINPTPFIPLSLKGKGVRRIGYYTISKYSIGKLFSKGIRRGKYD